MLRAHQREGVRTVVNTNALAIRGLYYAANHDRMTRLAVARWLANRYGSPAS